MRVLRQNRIPGRFNVLFIAASAIALGIGAATSGTLTGHVRDPNWYAQYQNQPFGVGYYEYAVNANGWNIGSVGGADDTDVFGVFSMNNLPQGDYTVASWDVWWRSAYAFHVAVPAAGSTPDVDVRLRATMWGYPAFWDDTSYHEFGQTFVATGPVAMIYVRSASSTSYTMTVHEGGPGGAQIGVSRGFSGSGDRRLIYGYGDMPTVAGNTYYVRIRTSSPSTRGNLRQMEPRPDNSDPMPGGCLWLGDGVTLTPHPDRDLGLIIMSDDDGLISNLFTRRGGGVFDGATTVGQSFVARGVGLISAAFWLADPSAPIYSVRVLENGPTGAPVGTVKRGRPARLSADPEMIVTWSPGECPLVPGQTYYVEVSRDGGGTFNQVFINDTDPFPYGTAFRNGVPMSGRDLAGTLMEEESAGAAARPTVAFVDYPQVVESDRGVDKLIVRWTTDVPSDSQVVYALDAPPYFRTNYNAQSVTEHVMTLSSLLPHSIYHFQVASAAPGFRTAVSRDLVSVTLPSSPNLLANGDFESTVGPSPANTILGWTKGGSLDIKGSDGTWFNGIPPHTGNWLVEGAVNGGNADGFIYQRVTGLTPGERYTLSAWISTWMRENGQFKYDVWNEPGRLSHVRLGFDPSGGADPDSALVRWTPRVYSHLRYHPMGLTLEATGSVLTVFVRMEGQGGDWHLYGVDDVVLTPTAAAPVPRRAITYQGDPTTVALWFSSDVDKASAENIQNYTMIDPQDGTSLSVVNASLGGSDASVVLETTPLIEGVDYVLTVSNVVRQGESSAADFLNGTIPVLLNISLVPPDPLSNHWHYFQSEQAPDSDWREILFDPLSWSVGDGPFGVTADETLSASIRTPLLLGPDLWTHYFRFPFETPLPVQDVFLNLGYWVDDGAVFYLNGQEIHRVGMGNGTVTHNTPASRIVENASLESPAVLGPLSLPGGSNVLAVEVHQEDADSPDVYFNAIASADVVPSDVVTQTELHIQLIGYNVRLTWKGSQWRLLTATRLEGPWIPIFGATSPYETSLLFRIRYFRLVR